MAVQDQLQAWRIAEFDLELLKARNRTHSFPRHWHETFVVEVVEKGVNGFLCGRTTYAAPPGSIIVIHPMEVHTGYSVDGSALSYRALYPRPQFMAWITAQWNHSGNVLPSFPGRVIQDAKLACNLVHAHEALERTHDSMEGEYLLLKALSMLIAQHGDRKTTLKPVYSESFAVKRTIEFLHAHHRENINLSQLADAAGLSVFHFLRAFRREVGLPPYEFLRTVRVERAKGLLLKGYPIATVALETGFYDQSHLNRHFKSLTGLTPRQFAGATR